jgi:hypothetical protein
MTIISGNTWPNLRGLDTTTGFYESFYRPDPDHRVVVIEPDGVEWTFDTPGLADWRLTVVGGRLAIRYSRYVNGGKAIETVITDIAAGEVVGDGLQGPALPAGGGMTDEQLHEFRAQISELKTLVANVAAGTDGMWRDVVGRLKAHDEETDSAFGTLSHHLGEMPTAEQLLLTPAAPDHWGLDPRAQSGTLLQDMIMVLLSDQAKLQVFLTALFEAARNLKAEGVLDVLAPPTE